MKQLFIIPKPHSVVQLITNSSTELFSMDSENSIEFIIEVLNDLINLHNKLNKTHLSFDDVFQDPYESDSQIKLYGATYNSIPYWMFDLIEDTFNAERIHLG